MTNQLNIWEALALYPKFPMTESIETDYTRDVR